MVRQDHRGKFADGFGERAHPVFGGGQSAVIFFPDADLPGQKTAFLIVDFRNAAEGAVGRRSRRMGVDHRSDLWIVTMNHGVESDRVVNIRIDQRIMLHNLAVEIEGANIGGTKRAERGTETVHEHAVLADGYAQMPGYTDA